MSGSGDGSFELASADSPDSVDSTNSPNSADSSNSVESTNSPNSVDSRDSNDSDEERFDGRFWDVNPANAHYTNIDELGARGITTGDADGRYNPSAYLTRAQFATFLARALQLEPSPGQRFTDVDPDSAHAPTINAIAAAGITSGISDDEFDPNGELTRAQLATLLIEVLGLEPTVEGRFTDVSPDSVHAGAIDAAAKAGITSGVSADRFDPNGTLRRDQMATLLIRALAS